MLRISEFGCFVRPPNGSSWEDVVPAAPESNETSSQNQTTGLSCTFAAAHRNFAGVQKPSAGEDSTENAFEYSEQGLQELSTLVQHEAQLKDDCLLQLPGTDA